MGKTGLSLLRTHSGSTDVHTIPWYLSNPIFLLIEIDEFVSQTTTQLSAHNVTPKLMDNGMKVIQNIKNAKNKTHANKVLLTNNTLSTHTQSHGYRIQITTMQHKLI